MNNRYVTSFPSTPPSPQMNMRQSQGSQGDPDKYLSELLAERHKLSPFMQVLPNCSRLLNQEIVRVTARVGNSSYTIDNDGIETNVLVNSSSMPSSGPVTPPGPPPPDLTLWNPMQADNNMHLRSVVVLPAQGGNGQQIFAPPGTSGPVTQIQQLPLSFGWPQQAVGPIVKKTRRLEVPIEKQPAYNFVGRILGPRGNTLKRVEAQTGCRVLIRGRGSIKDTAKEEKMRDKTGFEHLNEPLHVLVEAELPAGVVDAQINQACEILEGLLKPEENFDVVKREQLRELAILNGTLREDNPSFIRGTSPFTGNPGMKRAKTRR